ncbi:MAG: aminotransferase class IV [Chlamydiia bacterium]|nr:aminotransferase class IV [Chlamydiia bacterium]
MRSVVLNGTLLDATQASIPITDRGFLFGEGVFTSMRVQEGQIWAFDHHCRRLARQSEAVGLQVRPLLRDDCQRLLDANGCHHGLWRLKVLVTPAIQLLTVEPFVQETQPLRVITYPDPVCGPWQRIKSLAYAERLWLRRWAQDQGFDEVLTLGPQGEVLELASSNLFWKLGDRYFTPDPVLPLLKGVCLELLEEAGVSFTPIRCRPEDIPPDAQVFACNAVQGVRSVRSIDAATYRCSEPPFSLSDHAGIVCACSS